VCSFSEGAWSSAEAQQIQVPTSQAFMRCALEESQLGGSLDFGVGDFASCDAGISYRKPNGIGSSDVSVTTLGTGTTQTVFKMLGGKDEPLYKFLHNVCPTLFNGMYELMQPGSKMAELSRIPNTNLILLNCNVTFPLGEEDAE
jgi:hypothetical protein